MRVAIANSAQLLYPLGVMRLLFVADGRSPIALSWISYFVEAGHQVHLVSTYPCDHDPRLVSYHVVPVAFSRLAGAGKGASASQGRLRGAAVVRVRTLLRQWLGPLTLPGAVPALRALYNQIQPDLVHAMRIPYEGMLSALANPPSPLLISVWGNDFTLHATSNPLLARYTRLALRRTDALHADCQRDVRLAYTWEFDKNAPTVVLPGAGGVQGEVFYPPSQTQIHQAEMKPLVINPRGIRAYVRNDTFFKAIPVILQSIPDVRFVCPVMLGEPEAHTWIEQLNLTGSVELLPYQTRLQMADLFRRSLVAVSPSTHDGTPNTLLEAMACGCLPVAGDLESVREWIEPDVNGLLIDPSDPSDLANAVIAALKDTGLRQKAAEYNLRLIQTRAEHQGVMERAEKFYRNLLKN